MIKIGLTGSIGMGKSTTAQLFRESGVPVFDADAVVHALQSPGGKAMGPICQAFPSVFRSGLLDRDRLASIVFNDKKALQQLEAILHPMVADERAGFLAKAEKEGHTIVVFDIPLLFEKDYGDQFDYIVTVTAPAEIQQSRVLERPGMTVEKFKQVLASQLPDCEKKARSDFVIDTSTGIDNARKDVAHILKIVRENKGEGHA